MKTLIATALTLSLSACSTYGATQSRPPLIEFTTAKSPDAYMGCLAPVFAGLVSISVIPDSGSQVLMATGAGPEQIVATTTVTPVSSGSRVVYRQMHDRSWNNFGKMQQAVRDCGAP